MRWKKVLTGLMCAALWAMPHPAAAADCTCRVVEAAPGLTFDGKAVTAGMELPCGVLISASAESALTLHDGMRLTLGSGASLELASAFCGGTGGARPARLRGAVRLSALNMTNATPAQDVPAAFRDGQQSQTPCGVVEAVEGTAVLLSKGEPPLPLEVSGRLFAGERIRTGADGFVLLRLPDGSALMLGAEQTLTLPVAQ